MIGVGSPNRPKHLGRNVLTCQSSIYVHIACFVTQSQFGGLGWGYYFSYDLTLLIFSASHIVNLFQVPE